ncbi:hypothetical protein O181_121194 [Austropuccinia psidii MF-1]|uniref:Uncharacterized protein n=1 Tax=Austropuccinia psidii MF-1 TaxID=1389203 RepID=A0A9Q3Q147_9BASI|nr:hypothetical protein [Austropuccinia psidii MF-1]
MHLTPSRSFSGVSLATTEASGDGSEMQNKRRKKSKKKAAGDSKPNFTLKDYNNICCYIEEEENYDCLFGKSTKTNISKQLMTRQEAYKLFVGYLNALNPALEISGCHCAQWFSTYKKNTLLLGFGLTTLVRDRLRLTWEWQWNKN